MEQSGNRGSARIIAALLLVLGVGVALRVVYHRELEPAAAADLLRGIQGRPFAVPAFLLAYVLFTTAFVPTTLFHLLAGAVWGFGPGLVLNLVWANAVANLQFHAARRVGRDRVSTWLQRLWRGRFHALAAGSTVPSVMAIRMLPIPGMAVNLALGVSPLPAGVFAIGTGLATLPHITVASYFAAAVIDGVAGAKEQAVRNAIFGGIAVLLVSMGPRAIGLVRARRAERTAATLQNRDAR